MRREPASESSSAVVETPDDTPAVLVARRWFSEFANTVGSAGLERVEQMLRIRAGEATAETPRFQKPTFVHMPGLTARPWHDPSTLSRWSSIRKLVARLRDELDELLEHGICQPYVEPFEETLHDLSADDPKRTDLPDGKIATKEAWTAFFLYRGGVWNEDNALKWPTARKVIEMTPYAPGHGLCSILEPHSLINLHTGGCNMILTCHLPLVVPPACGLQVGLEQRLLEDGQLLVFDDSFLHRAWNKSASRRINLLWEVWHPELSDIEIRALSVLYPMLVDASVGARH